MKRIYGLLILVGLALFFSGSVTLGYILGSSNFDSFGYPQFSQKYKRPHKPYFKDYFSVNQYSAEVKEYVNNAKKYTEAAKNDILTIQESINNAVKEANETINEHNQYIKSGY